MKPCDAEGLEHHAPVVQVQVRPADDGPWRVDEAAEEVPVALTLNGLSQAVMLATPLDLEDFALGFALTEGWVDDARQVLDVTVEPAPDGIVVDIVTTQACAHRQRARRRALAGRTGCGLCGIESLAQLNARPSTPAPARLDVDAAALARAAAGLAAQQPLQARCGGLHAAAWCDLQGRLRLVREDVGRHNALDKLIGARLRQGASPEAGFVLMSSRCSYELVLKVRAAGIGALACVSAPTARAVRMAADGGVALWAFVRGERASRYA